MHFRTYPLQMGKKQPAFRRAGQSVKSVFFLIVSKGRIRMDAPPCRERKSAPSAQANASQKRCSTAASWARVAAAFGARALPPTPKISSCATAHCIGFTAYALMPP